MGTELPLEKQLTLASFKQSVDKMSPEQAKAFLVSLMEQHLISVHLYTEILKTYMLDGLSSHTK